MIFPLSEGTFTVDQSKKFISFDQQKDQLADRPGSLLVDIVPFLLKTKNDLIVIDPGLGLNAPSGEFMIHENISHAGFSADDVSVVLLSHLHKDHTGGICYGSGTAFNLMFPNAAYYCQEKEMDLAISKKDSPSFLSEKLEFLRHSPNLKMLNGDGRIGDFIQYEISGGHTQYHQVFTIRTENETGFFGGDVLPQPRQLQRKFSAKYDYDGRVAAQKRQEYGIRAAKNDYTCLFFHAVSMPKAKVRLDENEKFLLEKVL